ncbi:GntR family transcriptional regulator [Acuticoccus sediminis]|uniref:GntR family transcriptional regulator n=1 Tax=Acuticoccus sediminis TaxID=2184697 RepID=UPI001390D795|nr:GntR family transcriptional regulator [Acuticoccus sediminis]
MRKSADAARPRADASTPDASAPDAAATASGADAAGTAGTAPRGDSASARVVRAVLRGLYEGTYVPGQRLVEPDLMAQFGVSRSTVRESIKRLEADGVVEVLPYRGAQIRRLSAREARDALAVVELCVGLAARQAAERIAGSPDRAAFEEAWAHLQSFQSAPESFEFVRARNRFYQAMTRLSQNRELMRIVPSLQVHMIRRSYKVAGPARFGSYKAMTDAILAGDAAAAEDAARAHMRNIAAAITAETT